MPHSVERPESIQLEPMDKYVHRNSPNGIMTAQGKLRLYAINMLWGSIFIVTGWCKQRKS